MSSQHAAYGSSGCLFGVRTPNSKFELLFRSSNSAKFELWICSLNSEFKDQTPNSKFEPGIWSSNSEIKVQTLNSTFELWIKRLFRIRTPNSEFVLRTSYRIRCATHMVCNFFATFIFFADVSWSSTTTIRGLLGHHFRLGKNFSAKKFSAKFFRRKKFSANFFSAKNCSAQKFSKQNRKNLDRGDDFPGKQNRNGFW